MRNAFVVLVSLCIGVVSGFIVPSSVPEQPVTQSISKTENTTNVKINTTILLPKKVVLPKSRINIDEKDLYEHATEKKNNQSERAFVYINQKYNKPNRNRLIKTLTPPELVYVAPSTPANLQSSAVQTPCPSTFDSAPNFNSKFQGFLLGDNKEPQEMSSYFTAPEMFRCKFSDETKRKDNSKVKIQMPPPQRIDGRRDYFELLKTPLLRPANRKTIHENVHTLPPLSPSNIPYRENYIKKYNFKNQYVAKAHDGVVRPNEIRKNYGFNSAFIQRPDFDPKELIDRIEDVANFEDDFINDDGFRRNFENNQVEDKLLNKYLKDTLADIPLINDNDKLRTGLPECAQEECISDRTKSLNKNSLLIKPDCQCNRSPSVKQVDPFISKDRSLRQDSEHKNSLPGSSELSLYEEILSEDSNMLRHDDVVRPPIRVSYTPSH